MDILDRLAEPEIRRRLTERLGVWWEPITPKAFDDDSCTLLTCPVCHAAVRVQHQYSHRDWHLDLLK